MLRHTCDEFFKKLIKLNAQNESTKIDSIATVRDILEVSNLQLVSNENMQTVVEVVKTVPRKRQTPTTTTNEKFKKLKISKVKRSVIETGTTKFSLAELAYTPFDKSFKLFCESQLKYNRTKHGLKRTGVNSNKTTSEILKLQEMAETSTKLDPESMDILRQKTSSASLGLRQGFTFEGMLSKDQIVSKDSKFASISLDDKIDIPQQSSIQFQTLPEVPMEENSILQLQAIPEVPMEENSTIQLQAIPEVPLEENAVVAVQEPTITKDWFDILRERRLGINYDIDNIKMKPKRRRKVKRRDENEETLGTVAQYDLVTTAAKNHPLSGILLPEYMETSNQALRSTQQQLALTSPTNHTPSAIMNTPQTDKEKQQIEAQQNHPISAITNESGIINTPWTDKEKQQIEAQQNHPTSAITNESGIINTPWTDKKKQQTEAQQNHPPSAITNESGIINTSWTDIETPQSESIRKCQNDVSIGAILLREVAESGKRIDDGLKQSQQAINGPSTILLSDFIETINESVLVNTVKEGGETMTNLQYSIAAEEIAKSSTNAVNLETPLIKDLNEPFVPQALQTFIMPVIETLSHGGVEKADTQYSQFVLRNVEKIAFIEKHIELWHSIMAGYDPNKLYWYYDTKKLLSQDLHKMQIEFELLKEIIQRPSFDIKRCAFLKTKLDMKIAYRFCQDMANAHIIQISKDDIVSLKTEAKN